MLSVGAKFKILGVENCIWRTGLLKTLQEEVKAAILLGSKGVDLPRIQQQLQSLTSAHAAAAQSGSLAGPLEPIRDTDIAGFLRNERENALLSVIEETRRDTFEHVEKMHWDAVAAEWDVDKRRILQALTSATGASGSGRQFHGLGQFLGNF